MYLKVALRNLLRGKLYALLDIAGLAVGGRYSSTVFHRASGRLESLE